MKNKLKKDINWIHLIGIGGITMAPLAIELRKHGRKITGSDKKIYEPVKTLIQRSDIELVTNFSYANLIKNNSIPGLIIVGGSIPTNNKELLFAKKQNIPIKHFPEILNEMVVENNSIVVAGSYGKTTITSMLVKIFEEAGKKASFMFGGVPVDGSDSIRLQTSDTLFSIVEGDEYIASRLDKQSKFFYYKPKYLILTAVEWDHTDIFKTKREYVENFKKFVNSMPKNGIVFANIDDENIREIIKSAPCKVVEFNVKELMNWGKRAKIKTRVIGDYNKVNAYISAFIAHKLGLDTASIRKGLAKFYGIKRRLEIRYPAVANKTPRDEELYIIDDFASSPPKLKGAIRSLRQEFPKHKLIVIFEPNSGSRTKQSMKEYKEVFDGVDLVILPKFKSLIKSKTDFFDEVELAKFLRKESKVKVKTVDADATLVSEIIKEANNTKSVVAFMSSHGMEERIQQTVDSLQ